MKRVLSGVLLAALVAAGCSDSGHEKGHAGAQGSQPADAAIAAPGGTNASSANTNQGSSK